MAMNWVEKLRFYGWQFEQYRTRGFTYSVPEHEADEWRSDWVPRILPFPGAFRHARRQENWFFRNRIVQNVDNRPGLRQLMPLDEGDRVIWEQVRNRYRETQEYFFDNPRGMTLVKPLGYGGNGLVVKCEYRRTVLAPVLTFVLKMTLCDWDAPELYGEEVITEKFDRAAHIVQVIPRSKVGMPAQTRHVLFSNNGWDDSSTEVDDSGDDSYSDKPTAKVTLNATKSRRQQRADMSQADIDARNAAMLQPNPDPRYQVGRKDFLLLEFVENGDLEGFLKRVNDQEKEIPNRVLWAFWLCLAQACLGMQYPPRKFHPGRHEDHPIVKADGSPDYDVTALTGKRLGEDLFEQEPAPKRRWAIKRWVHFDLDIRNILIGGLDAGTTGDSEHVLVPRLKVEDFGLAEEVKPNKSNYYYNNMRRYGKWGHYAPEQFGVEWDHLKRRGTNNRIIREFGDELCEQPVAGNYGAHTNVWCIGLTMWQLITKCRAPTPPRFQRSGVAQSQMPNHYAVDILNDATYNTVDRNLRVIVARCLAHEPRYRPQPRTLVRDAKRALARRVPGEPDDMIRQWVQDIILNPPQNNPPQQTAPAPPASAPARPPTGVPPRLPPLGGSGR